MLSMLTIMSMLMGSALSPDVSTEEDEADDAVPQDEGHDPENMTDGGLLAYASEEGGGGLVEPPRPPSDVPAPTSGPVAATEIAPEDDPVMDTSELDREGLGVAAPSELDFESKDSGKTKDVGLGLGTNTSDSDDEDTKPNADKTASKDVIKDLRTELREAKGDLDKETVNALREQLKDLKGSAKGDVLNADDVGAFVEGLEGNDRLVGGAGQDILDGGDDNDSLRSSVGNDILMGGGGSDILMGVESSYDPAMGLHGFITPEGETSQDVLDGGDGEDVLRMGRGDIGIGGADADLFFVQGEIDDPDTDIVPEINDFSQQEDVLVIAIPFTEAELVESWPEAPSRNYAVEAEDWADGTGANIVVNGQVMARVAGAQGIDPDDIHIVGNEMVGADWFDISHGVQGTDTWWTGIESDATAMALMGRATA